MGWATRRKLLPNVDSRTATCIKVAHYTFRRLARRLAAEALDCTGESLAQPSLGDIRLGSEPYREYLLGVAVPACGGAPAYRNISIMARSLEGTGGIINEL